MKTLRRIFILLFLIFCLGAGLLAYWINGALTYQNPQEAEIVIAKGSSVKKIANTLKEKNVIGDLRFFQIYLYLINKTQALKAGEYVFEKGLSLETVIEKLVLGKVKTYKLTIPEGFTIKDICRLFEEKKLMKMPECFDHTRSINLLKDATGVENLEGYLFPETYLYDSQTKPKDFFVMMTKMFTQKLDNERMKKITDSGLSLHDVVTLASLVEKETAVESERPKIAGVFFSRLKIGMPLQTDPAVIYGVPEFNGNLTKADLQNDTPYNTYTRTGLPKGPICSVGLAAIDAVLNPETTKALYFVAKGDGSHYFSTTLEEHNQAVQQYQLR
jgi:UPF0755 protein